MPAPGEVTTLLRRFRSGDQTAQDELINLIYAELRKLAAYKLRGERAHHTLTPSALVNEAWLRLCQCEQDFADRSHFLAIAAHVMRRALVDYARARNSSKR